MQIDHLTSMIYMYVSIPADYAGAFLYQSFDAFVSQRDRQLHDPRPNDEVIVVSTKMYYGGRAMPNKEESVLEDFIGTVCT